MAVAPRIRLSAITASSRAGAIASTFAAILGAVHLYLDFVNLFLFLLRLLGNRR